MSADFGEQLAFSGFEEIAPAKKPRTELGALEYANPHPIAEVCVEKLPVHLDQTFDYLVPAKFGSQAAPGTKVKVPFGGQTLDGYVVARKDASTHEGRLSALKSVVSGVPLLPDDSLALYRSVANYYGGSLSDVTRLAIPPRHARAEKRFLARLAESDAPADRVAGESEGPGETADAGDDALVGETLPSWDSYEAGSAFGQRLVTYCSGDSSDLETQQGPRAVWTALPGFGTHDTAQQHDTEAHWAVALIELAEVVRRNGKTTLIIVPSARDLARLRSVLNASGYSQELGSERVFAELSHELSAEERYFNYLAALYGRVDLVIGTRASALAPLPRLGLAVCWDDAHLGHQELHAPYPHTREILSLRSELTNCALVIGSHGRSVQSQALVANGWAPQIKATRSVTRLSAPRVIAFGEHDIDRDSGGKHGRLPSRVWQRISSALKQGPVLIQVPRSGYVPFVACGRCRASAHCSNCHGPLALSSSTSVPQCRWCGALNGDWSCETCGSSALRAGRIGSDRTAEELGRAFPGVPVRVSGASSKSGVIDEVPAKPALVVATPLAEPFVPGGYVLGALLDAHLSSGGSGLYADQDALDRWLSASALVRSAPDGGEVYLVGTGAVNPSNALVRWDAITLAERDLAERQELHLPPVWRIAALTGEASAVASYLGAFDGPQSAQILGPVPIEETKAENLLHEPSQVRAIIRVPVRDGRHLAQSLKAMTRIASAKRAISRVSVQLDPKELL